MPALVTERVTCKFCGAATSFDRPADFTGPYIGWSCPACGKANRLYYVQPGPDVPPEPYVRVSEGEDPVVVIRLADSGGGADSGGVG